MEEYIKSNDFLKDQFKMEKMVYQKIYKNCNSIKINKEYYDCVEDLNYYLRNFRHLVINIRKSEINNKIDIIKDYRTFLFKKLYNN